MGLEVRTQDAAEEGEPSVRVTMPEQFNVYDEEDGRRSLPAPYGSAASDPRQKSSGDASAGNDHAYTTGGGGESPSSLGCGAPEKKLTLFALRLAILEKAASRLGALGFIWATVVLLGGFAITLDETDFWVVTVILLIEGARIFSRSHELEWQHQSTSWSLTDAGRASFRLLRSTSRLLISTTCGLIRRRSLFLTQYRAGGGEKNLCGAAGTSSTAAGRGGGRRPNTCRTWVSSDVPLLPYAGWIFLSRNIGRLLYWLQLLSAAACVSLSLARLVQQDYGEVAKGDTDRRNRKAALNVFYGTALAEAAMFLAEKLYWEWEVTYRRMLERVNRECGFDAAALVCVRRFFYDAYSRCVNDSVFDGLRMDLVSYAQELLASDSHDEQLMGVRVLQSFASDGRFADGTLRKLGTSAAAIERLLEMLNWKAPAEAGIRRAAAEVVSKLAGKKQHALRVAGIPGAMESISSLLYTDGGTASGASWHDGMISGGGPWVAPERGDCEGSAFNLLGLLILKKLAHDHDNCGKIGNTRGLLPRIIDFTGSDAGRLLRGERVTADPQVRAIKRSLQLVKLLAGATGPTGEQLRRELSEIVFTISNIREILRHGGGNNATLQRLGIDILTNLAMDDDARERIGSTGGVMDHLLSIFLLGPGEVRSEVNVAAGEALAMLALGSPANCEMMLRLGTVDRLVGALRVPALRVHSARIFRNLCAYASADSHPRLRSLSAAAPTVLKAIMEGEREEKLLEVSIGLASQVFRITSPAEQADGLEIARVTEEQLAEKLVCTLRRYRQPTLDVPRMRRFAIELTIEMVKSRPENAERFRRYEMEAELKGVAETTSELECYNVFSGSVGLSRHRKSVASLVDAALEMLAHRREG